MEEKSLAIKPATVKDPVVKKLIKIGRPGYKVEIFKKNTK